jgi:hypothetical protein
MDMAGNGQTMTLDQTGSGPQRTRRRSIRSLMTRVDTEKDATEKCA